jgi:hypothetical protein
MRVAISFPRNPNLQLRMTSIVSADDSCEQAVGALSQRESINNLLKHGSECFQLTGELLSSNICESSR